MARREHGFFQRPTRSPLLYGAVNKRNLSSGETGEFASENLGSGLNPGGWARTPTKPPLQPERLAPANTFELFGITDVAQRAAVKQDGEASL